MSFLPILLTGIIGFLLLWLWDQTSAGLHVESFEARDGRLVACIRWKSHFGPERRCEVRQGPEGWMSSNGTQLSKVRSQQIDRIIERRKRCEWLRQESQRRSSRCGPISHQS